MSRYSFTTCVISEQEFAMLSQKCQTACKSLGVSLAGWDGSGSPIFDSNQICFNGEFPYSGDTFCLSRSGDYRKIVETNGHPYDVAVKCCLGIFKRHFEDRMMVNLTESELV